MVAGAGRNRPADGLLTVQFLLCFLIYQRKKKRDREEWPRREGRQERDCVGEATARGCSRGDAETRRQQVNAACRRCPPTVGHD